MKREKVNAVVSRWLLVGVVLVFFQVAIGGITRLTDSGLSITEWSVIQGTLPPLNVEEWENAFNLYKEAAGKQYMSLHADMTLSGFKVIFFWEYFHRLWARMMGFVFLIPFLIFMRKKMIPRWLLSRLGVVIALASAAAVFGWIMVASGLNDDNRTWVSAYKLVIHLMIATSLLGYLFWTWLMSLGKTSAPGMHPNVGGLGVFTLVVLLLQIVLGGLMAGMKAGLIHPHFPVFSNGRPFFEALTDFQQLNTDNIVNYEPNLFVKSWVQLLHRVGAYVLAVLVVILVKKVLQTPGQKRLGMSLFGLLGLQFILGVITVVNSVGQIPVLWGAVHQMVALILWITLLYTFYISRDSEIIVDKV